MKSVPSRGVGPIIRTILLLIVSGIVIYNMTIDNKYMTIGILLDVYKRQVWGLYPLNIQDYNPHNNLCQGGGE